MQFTIVFVGTTFFEILLGLPRHAPNPSPLPTATAGGAPRPRAAAGAFLSEASLHDVRLEPGSLYWRAQQTNLEYLLLLDVDRLVWSFRKQAGLTAPVTPHGGWEGPDFELRGHFVGTPPDLLLALILEHLPRTTTQLD